MDFRENISKVFYGVGAFFAALTVLYFGSEYILEFSPVTKSLLLFAAFVGFLVLGLRLNNEDSKRLSHLSIGLGVISFLSFAVYTAGKFDFSSDQIFFLLLLSALAFTGLGYLFRKQKMEKIVEESGKILLGVAVFAIALSAADYLGEKPVHEASFEDQIEISPGEEVVVGEIEVTNNFVLPRDVEVPSYSACLRHDGTTQERGLINEMPETGMLDGGESFTTDLRYRSPPPRYENISGVFEVEEVNECPSSPEEGVFYIFGGNGDPVAMVAER